MKQTSLRVNLVMNAAITLSSLLFSIITFPYVSRILQPERFGTVEFAVSLIAYFSMVAQLGIPTYGIRACARVRQDREKLTRTAHELLGINLVSTLISYSLLALALAVIPRLRQERLLYVIVSGGIFLHTIGMEWLYRGLELYSWMTICSVVSKVIALAATFLMIHAETDYMVYGAISVFASSGFGVANYIHARKYISLKRPGDCDWKQHLKPAVVFFAMACATTIYTNLDALMLGFMTTETDVGYYQAAVKIKGFLVSLVTSLGAVLLPRSAWYLENGQEGSFRHVTEKALHSVLLVAASLSLYFLLFAKEGILFLSGDAFLPSVMPMQVIMPAVLLIGLTNILGVQTLVPLGREKTVLFSVIVGAVVDLALNLLLIPRFHATGAAIGTLVAETVVLMVQVFSLRERIIVAFCTFHWFSLCGALMAAALASLWVRRLSLRPVWTLLLSAPLFFAAFGIFLYWRREKLMLEAVGRVQHRFAALSGSREKGAHQDTESKNTDGWNGE